MCVQSMECGVIMQVNRRTHIFVSKEKWFKSILSSYVISVLIVWNFHIGY